MIDPPELAETTEQQTACIPLKVTHAEMMQAFGPGVEELMSVLAAQGLVPMGPLFAHHHRITKDGFDFDLGCPVSSPVTPAGRVKPGVWPASTVARTIYHGPYEGLPGAWGEFEKWIKANGHIGAEDLWECYVEGPHSCDDAKDYETQLNRPLIVATPMDGVQED